MPLIAVAYVKGRPGATTTALGLAVTAPAAARAVVVECDPAGGDLMHRHRLAAVPSVVDLAAAARGSSGGVAGGVDAFAVAAQRVTVADMAVPVVVAPAGGAQTRAAVPELTGNTTAVLKATDRLVLADCGRLTPGSPGWPLLGLADVVVVMARARTDEVAHLREALGELVDAASGRLLVLLAAGGVYSAVEVTEVLTRYVAEELARDPRTVRVLGPLPEDRRAAAVLGGELLAGRRWKRLPLLGAYAQVWHHLGAHLPAAVMPHVAPLPFDMPGAGR